MRVTVQQYSVHWVVFAHVFLNVKFWIYENQWRIKWRMIIAVIYATFRESLKKIQACTGFEPLTSAIPVQRSTNEANLPTRSRSLNWFVINPWKDDDEVLNIWKSYMWTAEWRIKWRTIIAVIYANLQAWIFSGFLFGNCKSCVYNCDDHPSFNCFWRCKIIFSSFRIISPWETVRLSLKVVISSFRSGPSSSKSG